MKKIEERKVVLITGGAMGQGRAHALTYAKHGFDVVLGDMLDPADERFQETVKEVEALGGRALAVQCNITEDAQMKAMFEQAWEMFGRLDVVIANAGIINFGYTWELTDEQVEKVIDINLIGRDLVALLIFLLPAVFMVHQSWRLTACLNGAFWV